MKHLIPLAVAICLHFTAFSQHKSPKVMDQQQQRKGWVSLTAGVAIPMGDFGSTSLMNENAGLAKAGFGVNADLAVPFGAHLGAMFTFNGSLNYGDEDAVKGAYKLFTGISPDVNMTSWKQGSLLAGLYVKTSSVVDKPAFVAKIQGGYALTQSPEFTMSINYMGTSASSTQNSATAGAFVFNGGAGLLIPLSNNGPNLQLAVNYIVMRSTYKDVEARGTQKTSSSPTQYSYAMSDFSMTISNLMLQAGLAWNLH